MANDTKYKFDYRRLTWKNGKPINWNSGKLTLSRMIPNGISHFDLETIHAALCEFLDPFTGYVGWNRHCPIGAYIVSEYLDFAGMIRCCHTYGNMYDVEKGGKYYLKYQDGLKEAGISASEIEAEFDNLLAIMKKYLGNCNVRTNVYTDFEGCSYNAITDNEAKLNITIHY